MLCWFFFFCVYFSFVLPIRLFVWFCFVLFVSIPTNHHQPQLTTNGGRMISARSRKVHPSPYCATTSLTNNHHKNRGLFEYTKLHHWFLHQQKIYNFLNTTFARYYIILIWIRTAQTKNQWRSGEKNMRFFRHSLTDK